MGGRLDLPSRAALPRDLLAGVTLGAAQVGNAMANTMLAGVPPIHGLYGTMIGTPVGALTSSSQRMTIVTTAALGLAAGSALAGLAPEQRVAGFITLTVLAGAIMLAAGLLRAGGLVRFISNAVMVGFMTGLGVQIALGQLGGLTGYSSSYENKMAKAADVLRHIDHIDGATTLVGLATVALITIISRTRFRYFSIATALLVVTAVTTLLDLSLRRVGDIAPISGSFRLPELPDLSLAPRMLVPAVSLAIIALVQGAGISRTVPNLDGTHAVASRDFVGQGLANIASGLFGGAAVGGSVQATALNVGAGSRTRWSSFFAGAFVVVVVLAAAPLVVQVPESVTSGILIVAAISAIRPHAVRAIWAADRLSALVMAATFTLVLLIPMQYAILAGAGLSVLKYVYLSSLDVRVVRVVVGTDGRCRETESPRRLTSADVTVLDIYGSLFFAAGPKIRESLPAVGEARSAVVVLRLRGRGTLQSATIALFRDYAAELAAGGGRLYLAGVGPEMLDQLERTGLLRELGADAVLPATAEYYGSCEAAQSRGRDWLRTHGEPRDGG